MNKLLLPLLSLCLGVISTRADLVWYEDFNYADGCIETNSAGLWICHSPSPPRLDALLSNGKLQIGNSPTWQDDIHRDLCTGSCTYTSAPTVLYASFTVNCSSLPDADGGYFAHFSIGGASFQGKVFAQASAAGLPNTWQLGVSGASSTAPSVVFPVDLATNVDYQVVIEWDPVTLYATTLWVSPVSSADPRVVSNDAITTPIIATSFSLRQASSFGSWVCTISNLAIATTFDEAATSVWPPSPMSPLIAYQPQGGTNFEGDTVSLSTVAAGQGLGSLTYQWRKSGADYSNPDGNTNVLTFASAVSSDSGNYDVIVTTPNGLSVTSAVASLWITNPPVAPKITDQPTNTTVYFGQTATLNVTAGGSGLSYAWYYNNSPVSSPNVSGDGTPTLTITDVRTNNGTTGMYRCDVSNVYGTTTSSNAVLSAIPAPAVTIGYLRTLVDPVFFLPTNTTALWTVTGIVTTHTNITSSGNSSFYMQDETGGIDVFYGGSTARPAAGDSVTVTGPVGQFNSLLELNLTVNDPAHGLVINSSGNLLPAGQVLPFSFTNGLDFGGVGESIRKFQGLVVTLTNVYFVNAGGTFGSGQNYTITNQAGETFAFRVDSRVFDIIGQPIPSFAWTVTGPMAFFLSTGSTNRSAGYQILPTRYVDIVTAEPPAATGAGGLTGGQPTITWFAQPYMSYSIIGANELAGPYLPLITGLTFNTTAGQFTDTNAAPVTRFYKIISP